MARAWFRDLFSYCVSKVELSDPYLLYPLIFAATKGWGRETKIQKLRNLSQGSQSLGDKDILQALDKHMLSATFLLTSVFITKYS